MVSEYCPLDDFLIAKETKPSEYRRLKNALLIR